MTDHTVLFTGGSLAPAAIAHLASKGIKLDIRRVDLSEDELAHALLDVDAYILGGVERATTTALATAARLKVIAFLGVGYHAFVDTEAATSAGIAVTNAPGANAQAVAEFTVSLMLDVWRGVTYLVEETKAGRWRERTSRNIEGKVLGIIGMGTIGSKVARIAANGLGMRVVYASRTEKPHMNREIGAVRVPLDELLGLSDVISLHAAYGPDTHAMLDAGRLALVKPGVVLVNTSEAELIEPVALRAALLDDRIAAAALDGYYVEPVPAPEQDPHGLIALPHDRFLITPHTANATEESLRAMLSANVDAILNVLRNGDDPRIVNPGFRARASWLKDIS